MAAAAPANREGIFNRVKTQSVQTFRNIRDNMVQRGSVVVFVILALISIAVLIAFLVMKLKSVSTNGAVIVKDPLKIYGMGSQFRVDQADIPPTVNGQEFAFSMWVYLVDFQPTMDGPQLVFQRSLDPTTVATANPIVAFDGTTNRLFVSVRTNASNTVTPTTFMRPQGRYLTASIDYFPLQRWVHVVGAVKDDSLSLYMNASLYTVVNVADLMTSANLATRPVFSACTGGIVVGASGVAGVREARAYVTQFKFFNFALTPKDIDAIYKAGPNSGSLFAKLGLVGYGLRSPIYKIET
jgi:hypothetical protein